MQIKDRSISRKQDAEIPTPLELDIRPIFAAGASPCGTIEKAVASLEPGQPFILLAPFEPIPLFTKLNAQGFSHKSEPLQDGSWRIRFERPADAPAPKEGLRCCCSDEL